MLIQNVGRGRKPGAEPRKELRGKGQKEGSRRAGSYSEESEIYLVSVTS